MASRNPKISKEGAAGTNKHVTNNSSETEIIRGLNVVTCSKRPP